MEHHETDSTTWQLISGTMCICGLIAINKHYMKQNEEIFFGKPEKIEIRETYNKDTMQPIILSEDTTYCFDYTSRFATTNVINKYIQNNQE